MQSQELLRVVALLSAALLGFEISLMRILLLASWHHFAFLIISIALLGFGASGTALSLLRRWLISRNEVALFALAAGTAVSMPLSTTLAQHVPIEARFVPVLFWQEVGFWTLYWVILGVPFLLGASAIGLALISARERMAAVYAANLAGSGAGAVLAPLAMCILAPQWLPLLWAGIALVAAAGLRSLAAPARWWGLAASASLLAGLTAWDPPRVRIDPWKYLATLHRLERQKSVERIAVRQGPRAVVEVYRGDVLHDIPFLAVGVAPPPMDALTADGHPAGSILRVGAPEEAHVVDRTLMAFPYALTRGRPRVLLLGERSGLNVWLAARHGAESVDVVQPDEHIFELLRERPAADGGKVLVQSGVHPVVMEPRHFVEETAEKYDLIQLVMLESLAAGSGGMGGLAQDYLVTVEGLAACLRRLAPAGLLSVCRGLQDPPRDNEKLLATLIASLRRLDVKRPEEHIVIVRDYLAAATVVKASPWSPGEVDLIRRSIAERELTPVHFPGITPAELNQPDELEGPAGAPGDWHHFAAVKLFSPEAERFIDDWLFDIRPPTDDRPFFFDFFRLRSIPGLAESFGELWLTRVETAFLFVLAAAVMIAIIGGALTIVPLFCVREVREGTGKTQAAAYFAAIGFAYMVLEMVALSKMTLFIGDPMHAAAVTICAFLVFSGAGSSVAERLRGKRGLSLRRIMISLIAVAACEIVLWDGLAKLGGALPFLARAALAAAVVAPLAFLMGFPMPAALARLEHGASALIPWAWGVNGFASVLAPPLAMLVAMTWGFRAAGAGAVLLYAAAAWLFERVPGKDLRRMDRS